MKKKIVLMIAAAVFFCLWQSSFAIEIIQIDQPKIRLIIPPGETKTGIINVTNPSSEPKQIRLYLEDWFYLPGADGSKEFKPANTLPNSCASWINFNPAELNLLAYGRQVVGYTVKVPKEAKGGYYAILFLENLISKPEVKEGVGVGLAIRLGALFYIEPEGTIQREVRIQNLSLSRQTRNTPLIISADIKNTGNVDITASGTFHIIDRQGMVYARNEFNEVYTFPDDEAKIVSQWKEPISSGIYDLVITLDIGGGITKVVEAEVEFGRDGKVVKVGELR